MQQLVCGFVNVHFKHVCVRVRVSVTIFPSVGESCNLTLFMNLCECVFVYLHNHMSAVRQFQPDF